MIYAFEAKIVRLGSGKGVYIPKCVSNQLKDGQVYTIKIDEALAEPVVETP